MLETTNPISSNDSQDTITLQKPHDPYSRFSSNTLAIMDVLNSLTKSSIYRCHADPRKNIVMDEYTQNEKIVNFIDVASVSSYITYMRDLEGRTFIPYIDTTLEFSIYIERNTIKYTQSNSFQCHEAETSCVPFAQHIILDVLKLPTYPHADKRTIELNYWRTINEHPFKRAMCLGLQKKGIIYMAEFDANILLTRLELLIKDEWKPEYSA